MANLTAVTGNWHSTAASCTAFGGAATVAADEITIPNGVTVTVPSGISVVCRSLTVASGGTLVFAATSSTISIGDATAGTGNVALSVNSGSTITLTGIGTINFITTSATQQTIASGGKTLPNLTFNSSSSSASLILSDDLTSSGTLSFLQAGIWNWNGKTINCAVVNVSNNSVRTWTLGAASITTSSSPITILGTQTTITANTATITCNQGSGSNIGVTVGRDLNGASLTINGNTAATNTATFTATGGTVNNFTFNGGASKTGSPLNLASDVTCTGTFTVAGNSVTNRALVQSDTLGTTRTITAAAVSLTNVDFMDITGAGAATWSGTSIGDCLGNSGITFTTNSGTARDGGGAGVKRYAVAAGNWESTAMWSETNGGSAGASVPLAQDDVYFTASSGAGTYVTTMPRAGRNLDCTGFTRSLSTNAGYPNFYGSITLSSGMTLGQGFPVHLRGRGSHTITSSGKAGFAGRIYAPGGTYTLQDAYNLSTEPLLLVGTLVTNGFALTVPMFSSTGSVPRHLDLGSSTMSFTATTNSVMETVSGSNFTCSAASATLALSTASTLERIFGSTLSPIAGFVYTVANSPGNLSLQGVGKTIGTLNVGPGRTLKLAASSTITVTNPQLNGTVNGYWRAQGVSASNLVTAPDSAALSMAGDITIDCKVAMDDWTPAASSVLVSKWGAAGDRSYSLSVDTAGTLTVTVSADGTAGLSSTSSVATGLADGSTKWVRASLDVNNGSSQRVARFYLSDDGTTWSQLGTTVTTSGVASTFNSTKTIEIGSTTTGLSTVTGNFYRVCIYNSDLGSGSGTPVFDADFSTKPVGTNSFVESSANAATVTFTGDLAKAGDGRLAIISSTPGTKATLAKAGGGQVWCDLTTFTDITGSPTDAWFSDYPLSSVTAVSMIPRQAVMV